MLAALLLGPALAAEDVPPPAAPDAPAIEHHAGVAVQAFQYPLLYEGIPVRLGPSLTFGFRLPSGLDVGAAFRLVFPAEAEPTWAFEVALHGELVGSVGRWRPGAGLEIGASTRRTSEVLESQRPPGSYFADLGAPEPLWIDFTATPVRFRLGAWEVAAARLGVGVSLPTLGMSGRWRADLLSVERVF